MKKVSVLGCGRWGTCIAWYCNYIGKEVKLWGRDFSNNFKNLNNNRQNQYLQLPENLQMTSSLSEALEHGDYIIISISSQQLRNFAQELSHYDLQNKIFILCMKGIESSTGNRLTQVLKQELGAQIKAAVWVGPGHVQSLVKGIPTCMVISSEDFFLAKSLVQNLNSQLIRFYYSEDLIGNEVGAAAKNVIGIAAGMLDGFGYQSLKGALMARGAREISSLIYAMGGEKLTAYGLSHLGDYEATLFSEYSHNRKFGELLMQGEKFTKLAEGAETVKALMVLAEKYQAELPISRAVYEIIYENADAKKTLLALFMRPIKKEFQ